MGTLITLVGQKFGRLTVIARRLPNQRGNARWLCHCDCGVEKVAKSGDLRSGHTRSCGCLRDELASTRPITHGKSRTPEYCAWSRMINRCYNPNGQDYKYYGGRGIRVCKRWRRFENFLADMGLRPEGLNTLERIDGNKGYSPDNCKWASQAEQARNTARNHRLTYKGETLCISEWSRRFGVDHRQIRKRFIELGWSVEDAIMLPKQHRWTRGNRR